MKRKKTKRQNQIPKGFININGVLKPYSVSPPTKRENGKLQEVTQNSKPAKGVALYEFIKLKNENQGYLEIIDENKEDRRITLKMKDGEERNFDYKYVNLGSRIEKKLNKDQILSLRKKAAACVFSNELTLNKAFSTAEHRNQYNSKKLGEAYSFKKTESLKNIHSEDDESLNEVS